MEEVRVDVPMVEVVRGPATDRAATVPVRAVVRLVVVSDHLFVGKSVADYVGFARDRAGEVLRKYGDQALRMEKALNEVAAAFSTADTLPAVNGEEFVVPGSSVKGAVRSMLELAFKPVNGRVGACMAVTAGKGLPSYRHTELLARLGTVVRPPCEGVEACVLCDVFGNRSLSSRAFFTDFKPEQKPPKLVDCVVGGGRYSVYARGQSFIGEVVIYVRDVRDPVEAGLVLIGMGILPDGSVPIPIGALKYSCTDFGLARFEVVSADFDWRSAVDSAARRYSGLGLDVSVVKGLAKVLDSLPNRRRCCVT